MKHQSEKMHKKYRQPESSLTATDCTASHQTAVLLMVLSSYVMLVLDISIVITGLPKTQKTRHFSAAGLSWVQSAYTLAFGGLLLLGARDGNILV